MARRQRPVTRVAALGAVLVLSAIFLIPFLWVVSTSLKGNEQIFTVPPQWIPERLHLENYARVF